MRILFCNYEYPPIGGGGGVINAALARVLARRHDVTVLTSRAFGLPGDAIVDGVRVVRVPVFFRRRTSSANLPSMAAYIPGAIIKGISLLRREKFDVINTHFAVPTGPVGHVLSRIGKIPNVLSVHGGDVYDPSKKLSPHRHFLLRWAIRGLLRSADSVIAQSRNTKDNLFRYYVDSLPAVDLIPLGIDKPAPVEATRRELGFDDDDILFVTIGRLVARKRVDQLLETLVQLKQAEAKLVVIGSGAESDRLKELAAGLGLADRVHWTGFVEEKTKQQILQVSDVFVSTSEHEGFGLVFLEAMAYGLPVVCYDNGGQTDFLHSDRNGFVVRLNELGEFTSCCAQLAADKNMREKFGSNNLEDVEMFFIDRCAERYESKFEEVVASCS
jgi:glycosyltransferase involved in cell wall biosynthesis